jgi:hypothetical protein
VLARAPVRAYCGAGKGGHQEWNVNCTDSLKARASQVVVEKMLKRESGSRIFIRFISKQKAEKPTSTCRKLHHACLLNVSRSMVTEFRIMLRDESSVRRKERKEEITCYITYWEIPRPQRYICRGSGGL